MKRISLLRPFFLFLLLVSCLPALGQQPVLTKVPPPEGVYWGGIEATAQDPEGFIWIASQNGLYRYDGYRYVSYYHDPADENSPASSRTSNLFAAKNGDIWIGTLANGLDRLDPATGTFTHFTHDPKDPGSLSDNRINAIVEDTRGVLWVGTGGGLHRFHPESGTFTRYRHNPQDPTSLSHDVVGELYEDRRGTLWVGTGSYWDPKAGKGGLNRFHPETGSFTRYRHDPRDQGSLLNDNIGAIFEDSRGTFWVGTLGDGLHTMDRERGTFTRHRHDPRRPGKLSRAPIIGDYKDGVTFIQEDAAGAVWIGTLGSGVSRFDPKTKKVAHLVANPGNTSGLEDNDVTNVLSSKEGVLFFGTLSGKLYRTDPFRVSFDFQPTGARVYRLYEDAAGSVWACTEKGLRLYGQSQGGSRQIGFPRPLPSSLEQEAVRSLLQDGEGAVWVGGRKGLWRQDPRTQTFSLYAHDPQVPASVSPGIVSALHEARDGYLWVGTETGLNRMDPKTGTFTRVQYDPRIPQNSDGNYVPIIGEDKAGNLWVGAIGQGIYRRDRSTGRFKPYLARQRQTITAIKEDASGRLWVGSNEFGLFYYDPQKDDFIRYTDRSTGKPLFSNVMGMEEDEEGNLWVSSLGGLAKLNQERNLAGTYGEEEGLNPENFGYLATQKGRKGNLYIGATNGFYTFRPQESKLNKSPPQLVLTDFRLFDEPVRPGEGPLPAPVNQAKGIELSHGQNVFSFDFAGIHFTNPGQNRHLFMLENYDTDWRQASGAPSASYYQVPPGEYVLRVKAASSEGVWAERALPLTIHPPWWRTWWAYGMYGLLFFGGMWGFTAYRSRKLRQENLLLETKVEERTNELREANQELSHTLQDLTNTQAQLIQKEKMASLGELTAGIAHEIQNPLNFVNNFSEVNQELLDELQQELKGGNVEAALSCADFLKENEQKISIHGKRADAIVKNMLEHSRASSGQKQPTDLNALADEYLRLAYHGLRAKDKSFTCTLDTCYDHKLGQVEVVPQDLGRVLLNLYNNAFYAVQQKAKLVSAGAEGGTAAGFQPTVKVCTRMVEDRVELRVRDNGTGLPESVKSKIFQPFFTTKPTGQGTGLGLSLSYDIVTKGHGGGLTVESVEGEFSEFFILLPV